MSVDWTSTSTGVALALMALVAGGWLWGRRDS